MHLRERPASADVLGGRAPAGGGAVGAGPVLQALAPRQLSGPQEGLVGELLVHRQATELLLSRVLLTRSRTSSWLSLIALGAADAASMGTLT